MSNKVIEEVLREEEEIWRKIVLDYLPVKIYKIIEVEFKRLLFC